MAFGFGFTRGFGFGNGGVGSVEWYLNNLGIALSTPTYTGPTAHWIADATGVLVNQGGLKNTLNQSIPPVRGGTIAGGVLTANTAGAMVFEPAATNLCLQSQDFSSVSWLKKGTPITGVTTNQTPAPDGNTTADLITSGSGSSVTGIAQSIAHSSGLTYWISIYAKAGTHRYVQILCATAADNSNPFKNFDLQTGTASSNGASAGGYFIEPAANGFYRIGIKIVATGTGTSEVINVWMCTSLASGRGDAFTGTGAETIYLWQGDVVAFSSKSSPIVTTTATVTRPATDLSYPTASIPPLSLPAYQFRAKLTPRALPGTDQVIFACPTAGCQLYIKGSDNKLYWKVGANEVGTAAALSVGTTYRIGFQQSPAGGSLSLNGTVTTSASIAMPSFGANVSIGESGSNTLYLTAELALDSSLHYLGFRDNNDTSWFSSNTF